MLGRCRTPHVKRQSYGAQEPAHVVGYEHVPEGHVIVGHVKPRQYVWCTSVRAPRIREVVVFWNRLPYDLCRLQCVYILLVSRQFLVQFKNLSAFYDASQSLHVPFDAGSLR